MSELPGENGPVQSLDETDGAQLPDLKDVAEIARTQFADMLASEEGKKDLVIQGELMTLLEHVTPIKFLRKYGMLSNERGIKNLSFDRHLPPKISLL